MLVFLPIYYTSVTAVTQRALVVNDFLCCYLSESCVNTGISLDDDVCPAALSYVGDGTDEGNLGRLMLRLMGLNDVDPFIELLTVFCVAVGARAASILVLKLVQIKGERLEEVRVEETDRSLRAFVKLNVDEEINDDEKFTIDDLNDGDNSNRDAVDFL